MNRVLAKILAEQPPLFDSQRLPVTMEDTVWRLNSVTRGRGAELNWAKCGKVEPYMARAIISFMRYNIERKSTDHSSNTFRELCMSTLEAERLGNPSLRALMFSILNRLRSEGREWRFHYVRDWYRWSSDQSCDGFDDAELYWEMTSLRIPGNVKGEAVRSQDAEEGPLDEAEEIALRAALLRDDGPLLERAITWALLALGCNPANLVYLCEEDLQTLRSGDHLFRQLKVPRIKKRTAPRAQFKVRKLDDALARIFEELVTQNQSIEIPKEFSKPLFSRTSPRPDCSGTAIERFAYHLTSEDVKELLKRCVRRLRVRSHRTKRFLVVTPRRLRYTFATRKAQEGCSMEALAELLDHSDLQNVVVYYSGAGLAKRLDEALAVTIGPLVNRFMGRVVKDGSEASELGGRVKAHPLGRVVDIGSCGKTTLCTLFPPASCYLCPLFQPWKNAPHREVLSELIRIRDQRIKEAGRPEDRIAKQYDEMILAVGQVVALCER
ncbi:MAG: tyrosine-type recombinase/integrase [Vulcanimicrobiaceae bacterium]|jgi:integrase